MRFLYLYFMQDDVDRIRRVVPNHAAYWQGLALDDYEGGPFADRSGGLITFGAKSVEEAEALAANDPFLNEGLVESYWVKLVDPGAGSRYTMIVRPSPKGSQ